LRMTRLEVRRPNRFPDYAGADRPCDGGVVVAAGSLGSGGSGDVVRERDRERVAVPSVLLRGRLDVARGRSRGPAVGRARSRRRAIRRHTRTRASEPAGRAGDRGSAGVRPLVRLGTGTCRTVDRYEAAVGTGRVRAGAGVPSQCQCVCQASATAMPDAATASISTSAAAVAAKGRC
jgi:hypothetical protein